MRKDVDISSRFTAYTAVATINGLPAEEEEDADVESSGEDPEG